MSLAEAIETTRIHRVAGLTGAPTALVWLTPEGQTAMAALRQLGETVDVFFNRALVTLQGVMAKHGHDSLDAGGECRRLTGTSPRALACQPPQRKRRSTALTSGDRAGRDATPQAPAIFCHGAKRGQQTRLNMV
jgi:hypothetical protein